MKRAASASAPHRPDDKVACIGVGDLDPKTKRQKLHRSTGVDMPWFSDLVHPCQQLGCIEFDVPKPGVTAGSVLKHSQRVLDAMFSKNDPCIFKVGWTHSPVWRWANKLYGYQQAVEKWTHMKVLYVSNEPHSPAMLEAALIDKHSCGFALPRTALFFLVVRVFEDIPLNWP